MSRDIDYYDVEAMIRNARFDIRAELNHSVATVNAELNALREELNALREELRATGRVLASRTDHLA